MGDRATCTEILFVIQNNNGPKLLSGNIGLNFGSVSTTFDEVCKHCQFAFVS